MECFLKDGCFKLNFYYRSIVNFKNINSILICSYSNYNLHFHYTDILKLMAILHAFSNLAFCSVYKVCTSTENRQRLIINLFKKLTIAENVVLTAADE